MPKSSSNCGTAESGPPLSLALARAGWAGRLVQVLFPGRCRGCGAVVEWPGLGLMCWSCWGRLLPLAPGGCPVCALPGAAESCPDCGPLKPVFSSTAAVAAYRGPWRDLIRAYKFEGKTSLRRPFGRLLAWAYRRARAGGGQGREPRAVVGVPLAPGRLKERGFDQGQDLALVFSRRSGIPFAGGVLKKRPGHGRQSELKRAQRLANAEGAFSASLPARLKGGRLLLVDDILTTGATAQACSQALMRAGAMGVDVLVLARATLNEEG